MRFGGLSGGTGVTGPAKPLDPDQQTLWDQMLERQLARALTRRTERDGRIGVPRALLEIGRHVLYDAPPEQLGEVWRVVSAGAKVSP